MTPEQEALVGAYKRCFTTDDGKVVLADLMKKSTFGKTNVTPSMGIDPNRLIWDEAQRSIILYIVGKVEAKMEAVKPTHAVTDKETLNA